MNKILMVEEEMAMVQKSLERLAKAGFELLAAHDGRHGFQIARDKCPDLIITDATVPVMSGYEMCKAIKQDENTREIPIVVMRENRRMEDSFMFLGIKDFLNKPVDMDELESVVCKKLNLLQMMHLQKAKILVYGRPEILNCCQQLLKSHAHWTPYLSEDSDMCLSTAAKYAPDVILIDLLMHGIPADEMVRRLKSVPDLRNAAILTYYASASASQDSFTTQAQMIEVQFMKGQADSAGAKEYIGAFNPVTFLNLINLYRKDGAVV